MVEAEPETRGDAAPVTIPLRARLLLARAAAQTIASDAGVDLLHIKGDAVDESLRSVGTSGTDIDVLVRPDHAPVMDRALRSHGWTVYTTYEQGSPFAHAQTYLHGTWGYLDLHRSFPGIRADPRSAFDRLWAQRTEMTFAGVACAVPAVAGQALILILNSARVPGGRRTDVDRAWGSAAESERSAVSRLVSELDAGVAFAAATGTLDEHRKDPDYLLWRAVSQGGSRTAEWWGRVVAARGWRQRAMLLLRMPLVNVEHLGIRLGRRPRRGEIVKEFFARPLRALGELLARLRTRGGAT